MATQSLTGVTRNAAGVRTSGVTVDVFDAATDGLLATTISDSTGNYSVAWSGASALVYARGYLPGSPDTAGTTINLVPGGSIPAPPDPTPDAFSFTDVANASLATQYTSNTITLSGTNVASPISISGDASGQYQINGGAFTALPGTINPASTFAVRGTSSGANSTSINVTLTIGGVSDTYTVTTLAPGAGNTGMFNAKMFGSRMFAARMWQAAPASPPSGSSAALFMFEGY